MRVCIIGCGPAGLFAAEACRQVGAKFNILAPKKTMSIIGGAQYLHVEIPRLTGKAEGVITYRKVGERDMYALKVYGNMAMDVSWDTFDVGDKPFWSLHDAYAHAWIRNSENIRPAEIRAGGIKSLCDSYDLVINTAPKRAMCLQPDRHEFSSQQVFIKISAQKLQSANQIVYNGQRDVDWYRWSCINGIGAHEYSQEPKMAKDRVVSVHKPLRHHCDCHPQENYTEVGRYGRWKKGALTHEAYFRTMDAINAV